MFFLWHFLGAGYLGEKFPHEPLGKEILMAAIGNQLVPAETIKLEALSVGRQKVYYLQQFACLGHILQGPVLNLLNISVLSLCFHVAASHNFIKKI